MDTKNLNGGIKTDINKRTMNQSKQEKILKMYARVKSSYEATGSRFELDKINELEREYMIATDGQQIPRGLLYLGMNVR